MDIHRLRKIGLLLSSMFSIPFRLTLTQIGYSMLTFAR